MTTVIKIEDYFDKGLVARHTPTLLGLTLPEAENLTKFNSQLSDRLAMLGRVDSSIGLFATYNMCEELHWESRMVDDVLEHAIKGRNEPTIPRK